MFLHRTFSAAVQKDNFSNILNFGFLFSRHNPCQLFFLPASDGLFHVLLPSWGITSSSIFELTSFPWICCGNKLRHRSNTQCYFFLLFSSEFLSLSSSWFHFPSSSELLFHISGLCVLSFSSDRVISFSKNHFCILYQQYSSMLISIQSVKWYYLYPPSCCLKLAWCLYSLSKIVIGYLSFCFILTQSFAFHRSRTIPHHIPQAWRVFIFAMAIW